MSIYEDAFKGVLYDVGDYTITEINDTGTIDDNGQSIKVTPLAAACRGGHPNVVKLLLENGALPDKDVDKQTPLSFTICGNAPSKIQSRIITELLKANANINLACDEKGNTPLMTAIISSPWDRIVRKLVAKGAAIDEATKALASEKKREKLLDKESDTGAMSKQQIVDLVVGLVQVVIAYANDLTTTSEALGGVVKRVYDISGIKRSDIIKDIPRPPTVDQLTSSIADYAKEKKLAAFFPDEDNKFFEELAKKAVALKNDSSTDLGKPENIAQLTVLSLYEPVLYLDDSESMKKMDPDKSQTRFEILRDLVKRIASIATKIVPDALAGVELRFINSAYADRHDADGIDKAVKRIYPRGGTQIGIKLREKVLKPMVYEKVKSPTNPSPLIPLKRPVLVCIITDGAPYNEKLDEMQREILRCKEILRYANYEDDAVMFCISQIGQAEEAAKWLNDLRNPRLRQTTYCSSDRLDDIFQDLKANEKGLEVWLLKLLTKSLFQTNAE